MKTRPPTPPIGDAPLVRLRVRVLRQVRHDSQRRAFTVFCPFECRSIDVGTCWHCPRLSSADEGAIECTPPESERSARGLLADARIGGDACVGDAMGQAAVSVHAALEANAVARSLEEAGAIVAIVVDDDGHLLGLVEAPEAAEASAQVRARELARPVLAVAESAPLALAVDRMVHERARALPVVDADGYVVALLTDLDALHWVAQRRGPR